MLSISFLILINADIKNSKILQSFLPISITDNFRVPQKTLKMFDWKIKVDCLYGGPEPDEGVISINIFPMDPST